MKKIGRYKKPWWLGKTFFEVFPACFDEVLKETEAEKDPGRKEKYCDGCFDHTLLKDLPCLQYEKKTAIFTIPSECLRIGSKE